MKVLMIASCPYNLDKIKGGVEAVAVNLLHGFKEISDIELYVVSIRKELNSEKVIHFGGNIKIHYIPFWRIKSIKFEMLFHGRRKVKAIVREFQPDIIHVQGNGTILLLTLGLKKCNLVVTEHGILKEELKNQKTIYGKLSFFLNIITEKVCLRNLKNCIFISNYNKALHQEDKFSRVNSRLIYNPVNLLFFNMTEMPKDNNRLFYIGSISKRKGLLDLVKALNTLKQKNIVYKLDVIGGVIDKPYMNEVQKFITINKLSEQIMFHGWLSQKEIQEIYKNVSIFVLPSYQETLPVAIAEAMAAGRVVVASNVGGVSEMIKHGMSGFLYEKANISQLVDILGKLYSNDELKAKVSVAARSDARKKFMPSSVASQTVEFYKEIKS